MGRPLEGCEGWRWCDCVCAPGAVLCWDGCGDVGCGMWERGLLVS